MNKMIILIVVLITVAGIGFSQTNNPEMFFPAPIQDQHPLELMHLNAITMLTKSGENAEAYFNSSKDMIVWQGRWAENYPADQIWMIPSLGGSPTLVSTGFGKTTCAFFINGTDRIVYSSTHEDSPEPPPEPDRSQGYVWSLDEYDIFTADYQGNNLKRLTSTQGYDAETAVSPDGSTIVFTSMRDGDLDIYTMDINGGNVKRLTSTLGYDGGPFFSSDGEWIVFRSHLPNSEVEIANYQLLLEQRKVVPLHFEIQIMRTDGSERRQVTNLGVASFAPYMHPDGKRIIFCSNYINPNYDTIVNPDPSNPQKPIFNLFTIYTDGSGLEQITHSPTFDGFPMFSADGTKLIWCSNRNGPYLHSTNIFIADWVN